MIQNILNHSTHFSFSCRPP